MFLNRSTFVSCTPILTHSHPLSPSGIITNSKHCDNIIIITQVLVCSIFHKLSSIFFCHFDKKRFTTTCEKVVVNLFVLNFKPRVGWQKRRSSRPKNSNFSLRKWTPAVMSRWILFQLTLLKVWKRFKHKNYQLQHDSFFDCHTSDEAATRTRKRICFSSTPWSARYIIVAATAIIFKSIPKS